MAPSDPRPAFDARPPTRIPAGLLAALAACCLVAVIALAIAIHGGPASTAAGLALAILPVPLVMAGVLYLDRLEPEPPALLAATFGAGAAVAALLGFVGHGLSSALLTTPELGPRAGQVATSLGAAFVGALIAETLKGGILVGLLRYQRAEIDGVSDGVVYGAMVGLGFALASNLFAYVQAERSGLNALVSAFFQRALVTPLWDPLFSSMIGLGVAYAAINPWRRGRWAVLAGWVLAVLLHTLWDDSVRAGPGRTAVVYVILLMAFVVLLVAMVRDRRRIVGLMNECLSRFTHPAVMTEDDVRMLGDLRDRRIARQWARLHCGLRGGETMARYQLTATELALAYDRAERGQMEAAAFDARRDSSLDEMRRAAATLRGRQPRPPHPSWAAEGTSAMTPPRPSRAAGQPRSRRTGDGGPSEEDDD
jgi:RsiW-degrading membrane proteinase PrsW (M82 family)